VSVIDLVIAGDAGGTSNVAREEEWLLVTAYIFLEDSAHNPLILQPIDTLCQIVNA
jgi:hypothetical protein